MGRVVVLVCAALVLGVAACGDSSRNESPSDTFQPPAANDNSAAGECHPRSAKPVRSAARRRPVRVGGLRRHPSLVVVDVTTTNSTATQVESLSY